MKVKKSLNFSALSLLAMFAFCSCSNSDDTQAEPTAVLTVSNDGITAFAVGSLCPVLDATNPLTADEIEFLYALREDEKLAKDLTSALSAKYPSARPLANIASAEATHAEAAERILTYYEVTFPPQGAAGTFVDQERQARYNSLLAKATSLVEAYKVLALVEEENIVTFRSLSPGNPNIKLLIENMLKASSNHLKAYVNQLSLLGAPYTPVLLSQAAYNEVLSSVFNQCSMYGQKGNGGQSTNSEKGRGACGTKGAVNGAGTCTGVAAGSSNNGGICKGYRGGK